MAQVKLYDMHAKEVGNVNLEDSIFNVEVNENILHKAVVSILNNKRQGTKAQKTRAEVSGGGKKPWRQKGTGNARQGSIRAPQWKGGGVVFAAEPRDFEKKMNKKERALAIKSALTNSVKENKFYVIDTIKFDNIKTKDFNDMLKSFKAKKAFVVIDSNDKNVVLSGRNIENVKTALSSEINAYDIMKYENVLISKKAVENIEEVYKNV